MRVEVDANNGRRCGVTTRNRALLVAALIVLFGVGSSIPAASMTLENGPAASAKKRCKKVVKKVRGKKRIVKVCKRVKQKQKPKPKPKPTDPLAGLPPAGTVIARIPIAGNVSTVAVGEGAVWVSTVERRIFRIDPGSNSIVAAIELPPALQTPAANAAIAPTLAVGHGSLWAADFHGDRVFRIDAQTNTIAATIGVGSYPIPITTTSDAVWVGNNFADTVMRIDPATNAVVATVDVGEVGQFVGPEAMGATADAVWVTVPGLRAVVRIDRASNRVVATIPIEGRHVRGEVAGDADAVWAAPGWFRPGSGGSIKPAPLQRIDPRTNTVVATIHLGERVPARVFLGFGSVWADTLSTEVKELLVRIDPATNKPVGTLPYKGYGAVGAGSVWLAETKENALYRIQP